jgi:hypothetical protein
MQGVSKRTQLKVTITHQCKHVQAFGDSSSEQLSQFTQMQTWLA